MNYVRVLNLLVARARERVRPDGYVERHHVVPRSFGGSDDPDNIVVLTAREHFIAHRLLAKLYPDTGMVHAVYKMACTAASKNKAIRFTARTYTRLREEHAARAGAVLKAANAAYVQKHGHGPSKGVKKTASHRAKISQIASTRTGSRNPFYGKKHNLDTVKVISEKAVGRRCPTLRPFSIDGVRYERLKDAEAATGVKGSTIWHRCGSPNPKFINYSFIEET